MKIFIFILFIYLFIYFYTWTYCHAPTPIKERKGKEQGGEKIKKRIEAQRAKPRTPTPEIDALIDEEQTGKRENQETERVSNPPTLDP